MKALQIRELGHFSAQSVRDIPPPIPAEGEVLIDVHAAGVNFADTLLAAGKYQRKPALPFVLGSEFAGYVSASSPIPHGCPFRPGGEFPLVGYADRRPGDGDVPGRIR